MRSRGKLPWPSKDSKGRSAIMSISGEFLPAAPTGILEGENGEKGESGVCWGWPAVEDWVGTPIGRPEAPPPCCIRRGRVEYGDAVKVGLW